MSLTPPEGYLILRLNTSIHDRNSFSCGIVALDEYLRSQASQVQKKNLSATHVLTPQEESRTIAAYVSLVTAEIPLVQCPPAIRKLTKHLGIPVLLLARMAVDSTHQGKGLGEFLLKFALQCAWEINQMSGCHAVIVDAKDENAKNFYLKYGFLALLDNPLRLYLPVATLGNLLKESGQ